jgi:hypothetical protein
MMSALGMKPNYAKAVERMLMTADISAQTGGRELMGRLTLTYDTMAKNGFGMRPDPAAVREVVTGMINGLDAVDNSKLRGVAKEMRGVFDDALEGYRAQGGLMGHVKNYIPVKHNAQRIAQVGKAEWKAAYSDMVDRTTVYNRKNQPVDDQEWEAILDNMYDDIITNNASRYAREIDKHGQIVSKYNASGKFARRNRSRMANPKSAEAYLAYNEKFGVGDDGLFDMMMSSVESIGRDIGLMKTLGPMPGDVVKRLIDRASAIPGITDGELRKLQGMYRALEGAWEGSVDNIFTRSATAMHGMMSASLLGTASIAALSDTAFVASAKRLYGIQSGAATMDWVSNLAAPSDKLKAMRIAERLSHYSVSRFDGSISLDAMGKVGQTTNTLKNMNHRLSGLERVTQATGDVLSLSFFGDLGTHVKNGAAWGDLPDTFQQLLRRHRLNDADWGKLLKNGVDSDDFVTPMGLPDELGDIAFKLDNVNAELRLFATNSPDLKTRYMSSGQFAGARTRGDAVHLLSSAVMQFKSFPVQVWRNHFVPGMMRAAQGDIAPLGIMMMQATFLGGIVVQTKELLKGRPMYNLEDQAGELLVKSLWQAGFAGLIGDVIFKDPDGYRRNLITEFAGPSASVTNDVVMAAMSSVKAGFVTGEEQDWTKIRRAAKPFIPFGSLWYTKLALDRMGLDVIQAMADDDFYESINRRNKVIRNERGEQGWWPQQNITPGVAR